MREKSPSDGRERDSGRRFLRWNFRRSPGHRRHRDGEGRAADKGDKDGNKSKNNAEL